MKLRVLFAVDDITRKCIAKEIDGDKWNGRKATREEIEGKIYDGAEDSLITVTAYYENEVAGTSQKE